MPYKRRNGSVEECEFHVGDIVVVTTDLSMADRDKYDHNPDLHAGIQGVVIEVVADDRRVGVEFPTVIEGGHDCSGRGEYGHCWYIDMYNLDIFQQLQDTDGFLCLI